VRARVQKRHSSRKLWDWLRERQTVLRLYTLWLLIWCERQVRGWQLSTLQLLHLLRQLLQQYMQLLKHVCSQLLLLLLGGRKSSHIVGACQLR
jgi:hypothetical protein